MKLTNNILIIFLFFLTSVISAQSNFTGIIHYQSTVNSKVVNEYLTIKRKKIKNKSILTSLDKAYLYTTPIKSKLIFSKGEGLFVVEDKMSSDIHDTGQRINRISAGSSNEYYYNEKEKIYLIKNCGSLGECFIYDQELLKWQLTQESKKINGYTCYKATRNNGKVIAWYTSSIPIGFGPKGEYGLPGLILELEIGKIIFKATKITLNPKTKIKIKEPKEGKRVSYEEYEKEIKTAKKRVFGN
jgi:GLPGLI family protein